MKQGHFTVVVDEVNKLASKELSVIISDSVMCNQCRWMRCDPTADELQQLLFIVSILAQPAGCHPRRHFEHAVQGEPKWPYTAACQRVKNIPMYFKHMTHVDSRTQARAVVGRAEM